ncbi:plastocyanin [Granulicella aggregans]|uniref:Plastocyanin n=1 Tax=Granulicella aggregans TaxID=474949 RepID=A0A7W7ZGY7_9BACT|nr:carboxypeptidase regulatory-like domain-containing protein [Granulicella aggregans]MBB5059692.1 plastocyanin [Granulicella aggregans]
MARSLTIQATSLAVLALLFLSSGFASSQTFGVTGRIEIHRTGSTSRPGPTEAVVWLSPLNPVPAFTPTPSKTQFVLAQKDKRFSPHLLVVPVGSSVDFPNLDPFFHNVFSLFNGKRFDLGLYEGHTHRSVQFDREGVSYIFCNIHPDMGAVVVSLGTPYYAVSLPDGSFQLRGVPNGRYRLSVWAENATAERLAALSRIVEVAPQQLQLGTLNLEIDGNTMAHHLNKYGEAYKPLPRESY